MNLIASSPTSFWNVWEGYQPQQTSYALQSFFALWPTSCNITKCFGREIRMKSLAWWTNWAKTISKNGLARHWIKLTSSNLTREQWISMNQVIQFATFYPLVGAFLRSNLKDQLPLNWPTLTGKFVDGDPDRHSDSSVDWGHRWEWRSTHGTHKIASWGPF